eukprot:6207566-Pleurochrysis_carterae.AAC.3
MWKTIESGASSLRSLHANLKEHAQLSSSETADTTLCLPASDAHAYVRVFCALFTATRARLPFMCPPRSNITAGYSHQMQHRRRALHLQLQYSSRVDKVKWQLLRRLWPESRGAISCPR